MELAWLLFQKVVVMLIFLAAGVISYKCKLITDIGNKSITNVVMYVFTPMMILVSFCQDFSMKLLKGLFITLGISFLGFVAVIALACLLIRKKGITGKEDPDYIIERFSAIYTNCGFMGIPLADALFGAEGVFYITAFHSAFMILVWTHGVYMITGDKKEISIKKVLLNPSIIATFLGMILFTVRFEYPDVVMSAMVSMKDTVAPLAMIIAGVSISQSNLLKAIKNVRLYRTCAVRLVIIPLVLVFLLTWIFRFLGVSETALLTTILAFSCPTATMGTMMSIRFGKNAEAASQLFALTTVLSVITMPLMIYIQSLI